MRRLIPWIAVVAVIGAGLWWFRSRTIDYVNLPPVATGPWVAFGDSLTEGVGASTGQDYPTLLGQRLGVAITNLGHGGDTTAGALQRLDSVLALQPRVVLLCLGGNDILNQQPITETIANLDQIIDHLHTGGTFVVLIGIRSSVLRDRNEERFARLAKEKRVFYVPDILRGLAFNPELMSDTVHPNDAGYGRIAVRLEGLLRPLLPRLTAPVTVR